MPAPPSIPEACREFSSARPMALRYDEWPRNFRLPGLAVAADFTLADVLQHLCNVIHAAAPVLANVAAARQDHQEYSEAAALAELLVIAEEIQGGNPIPVCFALRGIARWAECPPDNVLHHVCEVVCGAGALLEPLIVDRLRRGGGAALEEAADLAELLLISEEIQCAAGLGTAFDETPLGELTPWQKLAHQARAAQLTSRAIRKLAED